MKVHTRSSPIDLFRLFCLTVFCFAFPGSLAAQHECLPPALSQQPSGQNIFSARQEMDLGDAIAEHLQRDYRVIDDEEVTGRLRLIGERLVKNLPPTELKFQFFLFDINDVNAFTLPGGRIYISRKMVAFAQSEDELAGVIAHELGHIVARHATADMTTLFREILGVTEVTDRKDIFEKYNRLIESTALKPKVFEKLENHEEGQQNSADLIGLFAMARAGYNPQAQAALWERHQQLKGKKSGFFAEIFGRMKPGEKRLREMLKSLATLPASCIETQLASNSSDFQQWQTRVISYTGLGRKESVSGVLSKKALAPGLRSDLNHGRFSTDGKYILAQDDSGVSVLTREPLKTLFRIDAPDAKPAQFSPDSKTVVLYNPNLRVEVWDIAEQKLQSAYEVVLRKACVQTALSSDGKTLACLDNDLNLSLADVATGNIFFEKKSFTQVGFSDLFNMLLAVLLADSEFDIGNTEFITMSFSPDAHYFVAGDRSLTFTGYGTLASESQSLAYDLTTRAPVPLKGDIKKIVASGFAFVGTDKIAGKNSENQKKSGLYAFPSGEVVENFEMHGESYLQAAAGSYLLVRTGSKRGLLELSSRKVFTLQKPILDVYNDFVLSEQRNAELGLFNLKGGPPQVVALPQSSLGRLYAADVSPDFQWLAVSGYSRGAVWNLAENKMSFYVRGFRGAFIDKDKILYADFPKLNDQERNIAHLNLANKSAEAGAVVEGNSQQSGAFVTEIERNKKSNSYWENVVMDVKDARTMNVLWSTPFPKERPRHWLNSRSGTLALLWPVSSKAASAEIKSSPALSAQMSGLKEKEGDYLLKVLDLKNGQTLGQLLIETGKGSFRIRDIIVNSDLIVISDTQNRTLVYSLSTGRQKGKMFGARADASSVNNLLAVENGDGLMTLYDLNTLDKREQFTFPSRISLLRFSEDGKRLFILTANQTVYILDATLFSVAKASS
jgi:WD40 repeat protein